MASLRPTPLNRLALLLATWVVAAGGDAAFSAGARAQVQEEVDAYSAAIADAVEHFEAGAYLQARASFERAHALQPSARTWRGLGLASYSLNDFVRARMAFERALIDSRRPLPEAQRVEVRGLLQQCTPHTSRLELHVTPRDAQIVIDGVATTERDVLLARGEHRLSATAPGYLPYDVALSLEGGEVRPLGIDLATEVVAPSPDGTAAAIEPVATAPFVAPVDPTPAPQEESGGALPWIVLSAAPAFAATAAVVWWSGLAIRNEIERDCVTDNCARAESDRRVEAAHLGAYETWTNVLLGASIATAVGGATLLLLSAPEDSGANALSLRAGPGGVRVDGAF